MLKVAHKNQTGLDQKYKRAVLTKTNKRAVTRNQRQLDQKTKTRGSVGVAHRSCCGGEVTAHSSAPRGANMHDSFSKKNPFI